jgi:hypothetical protein
MAFDVTRYGDLGKLLAAMANDASHDRLESEHNLPKESHLPTIDLVHEIPDVPQACQDRAIALLNQIEEGATQFLKTCELIDAYRALANSIVLRQSQRGGA